MGEEVHSRTETDNAVGVANGSWMHRRPVPCRSLWRCLPSKVLSPTLTKAVSLQVDLTRQVYWLVEHKIYCNEKIGERMHFQY